MNDLILRICLLVVTATLVFQWHQYSVGSHRLDQNSPFKTAEEGSADLSKRVADYPKTWLSRVQVDLTGPAHWIRLEWQGPNAAIQEIGPFHSTPGKGRDDCDCNDTLQSQQMNSFCTPKGTHLVEGFNDFLPSTPYCTYVTWIDIEREIGIHFHKRRPLYADSQGCIRVSEDVAQLIHNNAIGGATEVLVEGVWTSPKIKFAHSRDTK